MKRLSIKMRVTLWYTGLVVLIVAFVMAFILASSDQLLLFRAEGDLKNSVTDFAEDLDWENGKIVLEDEGDFFEDGINFIIYNTAGNRIDGQEPAGFPKTKFAAQQVQRIEQGNHEWLVYDFQLVTGGNEPVWVRGVFSLGTIASATNSILIVSLVLFPFLIAVAGIVGYYITKRAFRPIEKMMDSVSHINDGNDLTQRIDLPDTHDEIAELAKTFNGMFDRLQNSFESEKQFTSDASHELRTPTSVIISQAEYGLSQKEHPAEMKESLEVILKQGQKMSALVSQLLMMARNDRLKNQLHLERINISELAEIIIEELNETAKEAHIQLNEEIEPDIYMAADQTLLTRMLVNLITNAITYGKSGGWVRVKLSKEGNNLVGVVSDNGIGIAEEHLSKIWERFYRVDPTRTATASQNLGLGLSMVKSIIHLHHGTIKANSELGKGSEFIFTIPLSH